MKLLFRIAFILYALFLLWAYLNPSMGITSVEVNKQTVRIDYFLHAMAFMVLPIISHLACSHRASQNLWYALIITSFVLALSMEFLQQLVPGRTFNPLDIVANVTGVTVGAALAFVHRNRKKNCK